MVNLEKVATVYKLSSVVIYQQSLGDAVNRQPLGTATTANHRTAARLGRRRTHRVVGVRPGDDLVQSVELRRQLKQTVDGTDVQPAGVRVDRQVTDIERDAVEQSATEFLQSWNGSAGEDHQAGQC